MLIDIHTHATLYRTVPHRAGHYFVLPEEMIAELDKAGIDMAVVLPLVSPSQRTTLIPTEQVLEICARYPKRMIPFCNLDARQELYTAESDFAPYLQTYIDRYCPFQLRVILPHPAEQTNNYLPHEEPLRALTGVSAAAEKQFLSGSRYPQAPSLPPTPRFRALPTHCSLCCHLLSPRRYAEEEQLSHSPPMVCQSCGHGRGPLHPLLWRPRSFGRYRLR